MSVEVAAGVGVAGTAGTSGTFGAAGAGGVAGAAGVVGAVDAESAAVVFGLLDSQPGKERLNMAKKTKRDALVKCFDGCIGFIRA